MVWYKGEWLYVTFSLFFSPLGAILFRGFKVHQGIEFQQIVQEFEPHLSNEYRGSSPRKLIPGTQVHTHTCRYTTI